MTVPREYLDATAEFEQLLADVRDTCLLQTRHQAYHTLRAVLHVFRTHLSVAQALAFANVLPAVARAIFVEDWTPASEPPPPFPTDVTELAREVWAIRPDHNLAPDTAVADVTACLRRMIEPRILHRALASLPDGARAFWGEAPGA